MAEVDSNVTETEVNGISETYLDVQSTNQNKNEVNINKMVGKSESEIEEIEENVMIETSTSLLETFTNFVTVPFAQLLKQKTNATREISDSTEETKVVNGISDSTEEANAMNGISDSANGLEAINCISDSTEEANGINGKSESTEEENAIPVITDSTNEAKDMNGTLDSTEENAITVITDSTNEAKDLNGTLDSTEEENAITVITDSTNEANDMNGTLDSTEEENAITVITDSTNEAKDMNGTLDSTEEENAITVITDSTNEANDMNGTLDSTEENAITVITDSTNEAKDLNGTLDSTEEENAITVITDSTNEAKDMNGTLDSTEEENAITVITDSTNEANDMNGTLDSTEEENTINSESDSKNEANDINGTLDSTVGTVSINGTSAPKLEDERSAENDTSAMFSKKKLTAVNETLPSLIKEKSPTVTNSSDYQIKEEATIEIKTLNSLINEDTTTSVNETSSPLLEKANIVADTSSPLFEKDASAKTETPVPMICEEQNGISHTSGSLSEEEETMTETSAPLSKDETNAVNKAPSQSLEIASSTNEISDTNLDKKMSAELLLEETTAITEEEANAIRETWTVLWSNKKESGIALLIKLFTTYPEAQKMFPMFDGLTIEEVRSSKKLRAHALSLMYALKSFLDNLDDSDTLDGLVRKNAINHAKRGVGAKELMWLLPLFLELLDEIMEESVTELQKKAWTKIYNVLASISREEVNSLIVNWAQLLPEGTTSMTEEDALAISESWTVVWSDKKKNGMTLFIKLFTTHPEAQRMFKDFDGLTIEAMTSSKKLGAHALSFMYALKSFLDNLDDPDTLEGLVRKNAINHAVRGVGPKEIMLLLPLFLELLDETTGDNVTELEKKAWAKLYVVLASISREEVNNLSAQLLAEEPPSITEHEANIISETWTVVWSDKKKNGIALFVKLFTTYPEAQKMFKEFDGLTIDEVRSNKKLGAHALALMYALKSFLDNLDDPETLEALVRKNAINHAKRSVGPQQIMWLQPLFLELLDELLEENATELLKKAWTKLFGLLASISQEEVNNLKEKHE